MRREALSTNLNNHDEVLSTALSRHVQDAQMGEFEMHGHQETYVLGHAAYS